MTRRQLLLCAAAAAFALTLLRAASPLVHASQQTPSNLIESLAGRDSFELYCAPCHGSGGRGDGPVASALRARPADLTTLARRNSGAFPRDRVREFVTGSGRPLAAQVWGDAFRAVPGDATDAAVKARIDAIVRYLAGIQELPA